MDTSPRNLGSSLGIGIGAKLRELRRGKKLTQKALADLCGVSPSYIGLVETGVRRIEQEVFARVCAALEIETTNITGVLAEHVSGPSDATEIIVNVRRTLDEACAHLGASSITFYLRDPIWPDELRLIAMPGVKIQEPMHGFVSPEGTRQVLLQGECEYCPDTLDSTDRRDTLLKLPSSIPAAHRYLFGDFVEREAVRASARLVLRRDESIEGVLFVNFPAQTDFTSSLKLKLKEICEYLNNQIQELTRAVHFEDAPIFQQAIRLVRPMQDWVARIGRQEQTLEHYLESVLDDVMNVIGMDINEGFGTIHLYHAESQDLFLAAHRGNMDRERAKVQSVVRGEGVISWVALRERAIVIDDLTTSVFAPIHLRVRQGIRSELAVPMIAGNTLTGVLNLESINPGRFNKWNKCSSPLEAGQHVRALWYAAGCAGVAARLYHQASITRRLGEMNARLLEWFCRAVSSPEAQKQAINALADVARLSFDAELCDIWCFDPNQSYPFYSVGASYPLDSESRPRKGGWSEYVCRARVLTWIGNIRTRYSADVSFWDDESNNWAKTPPRPGTPTSANQRVLDLGVGSELGLPLISGQECVGAAWIKFGAIDRFRPDKEEMLLAARFAESAGRFLRSVSEQQLEHPPLQQL